MFTPLGMSLSPSPSTSKIRTRPPSTRTLASSRSSSYFPPIASSSTATGSRRQLQTSASTTNFDRSPVRLVAKRSHSEDADIASDFGPVKRTLDAIKSPSTPNLLSPLAAEAAMIDPSLDDTEDILQKLEKQFTRPPKKNLKVKLQPVQILEPTNPTNPLDQSPQPQVALTEMSILPNPATALENLLNQPQVQLVYGPQPLQLACAKPFSTCPVPFLQSKQKMLEQFNADDDNPAAFAELQLSFRTSQARDTTILARIFSFLRTTSICRIVVHVCHFWRICSWHDLAWNQRGFIVGEQSTAIDPSIQSIFIHDLHSLHSSTSLATRLKIIMPKAVRDRLETFTASSLRTQLPTDMDEFKIDFLMLFPNLTRLTLDLSAINGGKEMRQKSLNSNRVLEDVVVAKHLRHLKHFTLESNIHHIEGTTELRFATPSSTGLMVLPPEHRGGQWLSSMITFWAQSHVPNESISSSSSSSSPTEGQPPVVNKRGSLTGPPSPSKRRSLTGPLSPSKLSRPTITPAILRPGLMTLNLKGVLFQGCWILHVIEKAHCQSLESLALSVSFVSNKVFEDLPPDLPTTLQSLLPHNRAIDEIKSDAKTSPRLRNLLKEGRIIPSLFHSLENSLTSLELNLENDPILAETESVTESSIILIFLPILRHLRSLTIKNLNLSNEGAAIIPYSVSNPLPQTLEFLRRSPPAATLFQIPSWKLLQRIKKLDKLKEALLTPSTKRFTARNRANGTNLNDTDSDEDGAATGEEKTNARPERDSLDKFTPLQRLMLVVSDSSKARKKRSSLYEEKKAAESVWNAILCEKETKPCKCLRCLEALHREQSPFTFLMSVLSELNQLEVMNMDDLSLNNFTQVTTVPITPSPPTANPNGDDDEDILVVPRPTNLRKPPGEQHANQFAVLSTSSTVTFSSCSLFLLMKKLHTLTLPISCYEYDPSTNLVDSVCLLLASRLKHLTIIIYGNAWIPQSESADTVTTKSSKQLLDDLYKPMPLSFSSTSERPRVLPFPKLKNLGQLSALHSLSLKRDTDGLSSLDPILPIMPLIQTLSVESSPSFEKLILDGFALNDTEFWSFLATNLGGALAKSESTGGRSRPRTRGDRQDAPNAKPPSAPGMSRRKGVNRRSAGLRSLSIHNYYGTITGPHLVYLRSLPHLRFLSIGNFHINKRLNLAVDTNFQSFTLMVHEIHSQLAPLPDPNKQTHPLSEPVLCILSELLPDLRHLELIGQEHLTNDVFRYWSEKTPMLTEIEQETQIVVNSDPASRLPPPPPPNKGINIIVNDFTQQPSIVKSIAPSVASSASHSPEGSPQPSPASTRPVSSSTARLGVPTSTAPSPVPSLTPSSTPPPPNIPASLPPFPRLRELTLRSCHPLGYVGLAHFGRAKLRQLTWSGGFEYERRSMQLIQAAMGANKTRFQFQADPIATI